VSFFLLYLCLIHLISSEDDQQDDAEPMDQDPPSNKEPGPKIDPGDLSEYNLDDYDQDDDSSSLGPLMNIKGLTYYGNNDEDPYITLKEARITPPTLFMMLTLFLGPRRRQRTRRAGSSTYRQPSGCRKNTGRSFSIRDICL
jgi:hypothetical protein